jgi:hypothetical protein
LLFCLLYLLSILLIKFLCVIIRDLFCLSLIISTPKNSFISPKLVTSSLEVVVKSLYRLLIRLISLANTSISSTCVAKTIGLVLCIKILVSILKLVNPIFSRILVKNSCYCLLACFRPYNALFSLHTILE